MIVLMVELKHPIAWMWSEVDVVLWMLSHHQEGLLIPIHVQGSRSSDQMYPSTRIVRFEAPPVSDYLGSRLWVEAVYE